MVVGEHERFPGEHEEDEEERVGGHPHRLRGLEPEVRGELALARAHRRACLALARDKVRGQKNLHHGG